MPNFAVILRSAFFHGGSFICFEKSEKTGSFCFGNIGNQLDGMFSCSVNLGFGLFSLLLKFLTLFLDQSVDGESWSSLPAGKSSVLCFGKPEVM